MLDAASLTFLTTLLRTLRWRAPLVILLMVVRSGTDGLGVVLLMPLLQQMGLDVQTGGGGRIAAWVNAAFTTVGLQPTLGPVLATYLGVVALHALLGFWQGTSVYAAQQTFLSSHRRSLYRAIIEADWPFLARSRLSDFTHALTAEIERIGDAAQSLLLLLATLAVTAVYLVLAVQLSSWITALVALGGVLVLLMLRGQVNAARLSGQEYSAVNRDLYGATIEHLASLKTAKSYVAESRHIAAFTELSDQVDERYIEARRVQARSELWFNLGSAIIFCCTCYAALTVLNVSAASLILLIVLFARIMPKVSTLQQLYHAVVARMPSFSTVVELQARCEAAKEVGTAATQRMQFAREIRFEQVSFAYLDGDREALQRLDLHIRAGETTAIVGPSGAGKSTITDLVIGLLRPSLGRILVDGQPLDPDRVTSWRKQIGYVAQETFLFHDTVRANLLWAQPCASDEEVWRALRLAAAAEFVAELPQGLDTVLGDRGVRLSGGERQRLALARAMLRQPALLILDEATSSLDSENERRIQEAIEALHGQITILAITHRLSTIREADTIYVLERGCIIESGSWAELTARDGRFTRLSTAQRIG